LSPTSQPDLIQMHSSVPLFTGSSYDGLYIIGFLWGFILQLLTYIFHFAFDIFQWLLLTLLAGVLLQYLYNFWKRRRFRNPVVNAELIAMFEDVQDRLGTGHNIEIWCRRIDRSIFLSTVNPVFKAILLSESTIADLLDKKEKGKVVIAREILMMKRINPNIGSLIGVLIFTFFAFAENLFFFESIGEIIFSFGPIILAGSIVAVLLLVILGMFILSRKQGNIDKIVGEIFGFAPDAAMVEVVTGVNIPDEILFQVKQDKEERKPNRRSAALRTSALAAIIAFAISYVIMFIFMSGSSIFYIFATVMSTVLAFGAFMITFMTRIMWPLFRPGPRSTEWDIQVPFASDLQSYLRKFVGLESIEVRGIKPPADEMYGLIVLKLNEKFEEEVIEAIYPSMLEDIHEVDLAGPLILSEIRRKEIEKKHNRISYSFLGIAIPVLAIGMIYALLNIRFPDFFIVFFQIFAIYIIMTMIPAIVMTYWTRREEIKSDADIAVTCTRFRETLKTLIDNHHTLPYGKTSYRTRLERIDKYLGLDLNTELS